MAEAAWATWRTATGPGARFRRLARRFGTGNENKAAVAAAHTLPSIARAVLRDDSNYTDAGADYYERGDQRSREHLIRHHHNALARLGPQMAVTQPGDGTPPPPGNPGQAARPSPLLTGTPMSGCAGAAACQAEAPNFRHRSVLRTGPACPSAGEPVYKAVRE